MSEHRATPIEKRDASSRLAGAQGLGFPGVTDHPLAKSAAPPNDYDGEIIAVRADGKRDMVNLRGGVAYLWRYKRTDQAFCRCDEIIAWRGCCGFDY